MKILKLAIKKGIVSDIDHLSLVVETPNLHQDHDLSVVPVVSEGLMLSWIFIFKIYP